MRIHFHASFTKRAKKLPSAQKKRLAAALRLFQDDSHHPALYNHAMRGKFAGQRSISFGGDWRAHYVEQEDSSALFVVAGTHHELYGA